MTSKQNRQKRKRKTGAERLRERAGDRLIAWERLMKPESLNETEEDLTETERGR